jgi:hypothetical protein
MAVATLNDMATLVTDPTFGNRVNASMIIYASGTIMNESITASTLAYHVARKQYAAQVLNNIGNYKNIFVQMVGANQIVANDATASGTIVGQVGSVLAASALLCTDTDINNAVASAYNSLISSI